MARAIQKKKKMGWALRINPSNEPGLNNWMRVGHLFKTRDQALEFKNRKFSHISKFTITGVKVELAERERPKA